MALRDGAAVTTTSCAPSRVSTWRATSCRVRSSASSRWCATPSGKGRLPLGARAGRAVSTPAQEQACSPTRRGRPAAHLPPHDRRHGRPHLVARPPACGAGHVEPRWPGDRRAVPHAPRATCAPVGPRQRVAVAAPGALRGYRATRGVPLGPAPGGAPGRTAATSARASVPACACATCWCRRSWVSVVTAREARRTWWTLVRHLGEPAPGPHPVRLPPEPARIVRLSDADWHRLGVERQRADAIRRAHALLGLDRTCSRARQRHLPGAVQSVRASGPGPPPVWPRRCWDDTDAVLLGDLHLPHNVCFALAVRSVAATSACSSCSNLRVSAPGWCAGGAQQRTSGSAAGTEVHPAAHLALVSAQSLVATALGVTFIFGT